MEKELQTEKEIHQLFDVTLLLKSIHAFIEIVGGFVFLFISKATIVNFVNFFIKDEISEEPNNHILNYISQTTHHLTGSSKSFAALYLVSHGIVNMGIVIALWKEKLWAYPVSFVILGAFGIYQMYQYSFNHSLWLLALTILDAVILLLVWHEYKIVKKKYVKKDGNM